MNCRVKPFIVFLINLEVIYIQEWLDRHGPFDAIIDGANVSLVNAHSFNFFQVSKDEC